MTIQSIQSSPGQTPPLTTTVAAGTAGPQNGMQGVVSTAQPVVTDSTAQNVDATALAGAIEKVQEFTNTLANELKFSIDDKSGHTVVKIVDTATDEVIRQIPSEEMLAIADALGQIQGVLLKQKA